MNPVDAIAESLARTWGRMFTDEVTADNFVQQAAHIVREVGPVLRAEATTDVRDLLSGSDELIAALWREALASGDDNKAEAAELLTRLRQVADDGTFAPVTWTADRIEYMTHDTRHPHA